MPYKYNQSTESTERWHLRFTLTIERQYRYIYRVIVAGDYIGFARVINIR